MKNSAFRTGPMVLLLLGCAGQEKPVTREFDPGPVPAELTSGENSFNRSCGTCHGRNAMGTAQGPPLVHIIYEPSHHSDEAFRRAAMLGVVPHHWSFGPMPPVTSATPEQVEEIIAYVRWLQQRAGIT
jgi:mono/diheme cytochrome c family protein